jgi:response regulator RpfG family c-di-GMP phosphodiesterase
MIEIDASKPDVAPSAPACTVLCVDDEPNILAALKRTLRGAGFSALTADGGTEALKILEKLPVDIVVSDMRMPGIDGAQLLEQVHARWPHVVRILLTGHADQGSTVSAINRGRIFRYLSKPWDERDLLSSLYEGSERLALERASPRARAR